MDSLTEQIRTVEFQIAALEPKINEAWKNEEHAEVRALLLEQSNLNKTLSHLNKTLSQLQANHQEWTWTQWIEQRLPFQNLLYDSQGGPSYRHKRYWPRLRTKWENFEREVASHVDDFASGADGRSSRDFVNFPEGFTHGDVRSRFVTIFLAFARYRPFQNYSVSVSHPTKVGGTEAAAGESALASESFARSIAKSDRKFPDIELKNSEKRVILVAECKRPIRFRRSAAHPVPDLTSDCNGILKRAIRQITKYMVTKKVCFGILTSEDLSYFVKFEGKNWIVSDGITRDCTGTRLLAAFHYMLYIAKDGPEADFKNYGIEGAEERPERDSQESERYQTRSKKRLKTQMAAESSAAGVDTGDHVDPGGGLEDVAALDLNMSRVIFAEGLSGKLVRGQVKGEQVVIKIAPYHSERGLMLRHESNVYLTIRPLWGSSVPRLVSVGTTAQGTLIYLATEYIHGYTLDGVTRSKEVAIAALQALSAIHSCGVLHGDLHPGNVLIIDSRVFIIDFGMAKYSSCRLGQEREVDELKNMLAVHMSEGLQS